MPDSAAGPGSTGAAGSWETRAWCAGSESLGGSCARACSWVAHFGRLVATSSSCRHLAASKS